MDGSNDEAYAVFTLDTVVVIWAEPETEAEHLVFGAYVDQLGEHLSGSFTLVRYLSQRGAYELLAEAEASGRELVKRSYDAELVAA